MFVYNESVYKHMTTREDYTIHNVLPAGAYRARRGDDGLYFIPENLSGDRLVNVESKQALAVRREISEFFDPQRTARLAAHGVKHRRGVILHGEPGTGKTSLVRALLPFMIEHGAVVLVEPHADYLERIIIPAIRFSDADRPIVLIFDEFDRTANYSTSELLQLLDGLSSPDHLLTIGTTNHLHIIPEAMKSRPSRFGLVLELPPLDHDARFNYAASKYNGLSTDMLIDIVEMTSGMSLDYLEEACKLGLMEYETDEIRTRIQAACIPAGGSDDDE